jgi:KipI family sensor histidine kinase inhibitor
VVPFGDSALLLELAEVPAPDVTRRIQTIAATLAPERGAVPGLTSLLVDLDPLRDDATALTARLLELASTDLPLERTEPRSRVIRVAYGGEYGPDLESVARAAALTTAQVVELHTGVELTVEMLGFQPGFGYLSGLPPALHLPRLDTPRERVPAGSVAIAGGLGAIYPNASPGGWRLLGHTDALLFDPVRDPPTYLQPGDRVRFVAVPAESLSSALVAPRDW